jgi:hypothetical protein
MNSIGDHGDPIICLRHASPDYARLGVLVKDDESVALAEKVFSYFRNVGKWPLIVGIVSSPRIQCLDTALVFAAALQRLSKKEFESTGRNWPAKRRSDTKWDDIPTTQVFLSEDLAERTKDELLTIERLSVGGLAKAKLRIATAKEHLSESYCGHRTNSRSLVSLRSS